MAKRILLCGIDETLVGTRRSILEREGYTVSTCLSEDEAERALKASEADLIVLCSSLREKRNVVSLK
jgi:DNA-binding response OmpR family regulator